ncbi:MAG: hypothetical protein ACXV39_10785 [Halobacteriota archaeon]
MHFLIPALVDSDESEELLTLTLRHIPSAIDATAVVISQGRRPMIEKPSQINKLILQHYETPLTKWAAISRARNAVPEDRTQVVLLDADDPVNPESLLDAISKSRLAPTHCWIGQRKHIALFAEDELSADSRFFLEMFSNTLLLNRAKPPSPVLLDPPDIQSGFYVLPSSTIKQVTFDYVADYGGELALCYQLWQAGMVTENLEYSPQARRASAYRLKQIFDQVMSLPFFNGITDKESEEAKKLAPVLYRRYFDQQRLAAYEQEISRILACPR